MYDRKEELKEAEKDSERKKRENHLKKIMELFEGKENFEKLLTELKATKEMFIKIFDELLEEEKKLIKNRKIIKGELYSENREFFSELFKPDYNKDISNIEKVLINRIYENSSIRFAVDYKSNFYLDGKSIFRMTKEEKEKYEKYRFLIILDEFINNMIEEERYQKARIFEKSLKKRIGDLESKELKNQMRIEWETLILDIKNEKVEEKRILKYLLLFFHIYYIINVSKCVIIMIEELIKKNFKIPLEYRINNLEKSTAELLNKIRFSEKSKKDNLINEKIKSIKIYYINSIEDERIQEIPPEIENEIIGAYYRAIYLSDIKYKGKKLSSYIESYRRAEFILLINDLTETSSLDIRYLEICVTKYFTKKEINKFLIDREKIEEIEEIKEVDGYSVEEEEKYIRLIMKEIIDLDGKVRLNTEILNNLKRICKKYISVKKMYENFQEAIGMKKDIDNIINYSVGLYTAANNGKENLCIKIFKEIANHLKRENQEQIQKMINLN